MTTTIRRTEPTTLAVPPRTSGDRWRAFSLVAMRLSVGFLFLWAFLDKTFGLGYATPTERAWINGGSPTNGFLSHLDVGPLKGFFNAIAGNPIADWLFMLCLAGVGIAVMLGIGLRLSAAFGSFLMLAMWVAEWPFAQFTESGVAAGSTNPIVDYHIMYALALIVVAAFAAGNYAGLGRWWSNLDVVRKNGWLK